MNVLNALRQVGELEETAMPQHELECSNPWLQPDHVTSSEYQRKVS
jgi:hypothetical protein